MQKKLFVLFICLLALTLSAFAAVKDPDTIVNAEYGAPETLDPHAEWDNASGAVINNLYDNLIKYVGETIEFEPMLSTAVPTPENGLLKDNGKTYIFPIQKGVKFHSGNILTPKDIEYTFERGFLADNSSGAVTLIIEAVSGGEFYTVADWFEAYAGMAYSDAVNDDREPTSAEAKAKLIGFYNEVIDPLFVVEGDNFIVNMKDAFAPFLFIIVKYAGWGSIIDSQWCMANGEWDWKADGWWKWHDRTPEESALHMADAGCGPYKLAVWDQTNNMVVMERFDDYWQGPAKTKTLIFKTVEEYSTRKAMLEAGDADLVLVDPIYRYDFDNNPDIEVISGHPRAQVTSIHMGWKVQETSEYIGSGKLDGNGIPADFFTDINVRAGILHAFNYDALIDDLVNGLGKRVPTDLPEGFLGFDPTLPVYEFDLGKAEKAWKAAWGGEVWENGFKLVAMYNAGNEVRQTACEMLKVYVESINPKFQVEVLGVQWPTYLKATREELCPLYIIGWVADYPDAHNFFSTYYHSNGYYGKRHGGEYNDFAKEYLDPIIDVAVKETDVNKRIEMYAELQKILLENYIATPLYMPQGLYVARKWLKGFFPHLLRSSGDRTPEFYYAWKE